MNNGMGSHQSSYTYVCSDDNVQVWSLSCHDCMQAGVHDFMHMLQ